MPVQPPAFGQRKQPRKAWQPAPGRVDTRKRGRAGQRERQQVLDEEPLCRLCLDRNRTSPTEVVDHIKPLAWGGSDDRANKQGLCIRCHDAKSVAERALDAKDRRRF